MMLFHPQGWNPKWIQQVFEKLIAHHDALRMTYHVENGRIQQVNRGLEGDFFVFHSFDLRGVNHVRTEIEQHAHQLQQNKPITAS